MSNTIPESKVAEAVKRLAPPGAGLLAVELFFARFMVKFMARRTGREAAARRFATEAQALLKMVEDVPPELLAQPVLIKRLPGLEDSSRFWSVLMTLDHLRIVNGQIAEAVVLLGNGQVPPVAACTAAVKPDPAVPAGVVEAFRGGCAEFERKAASVADLKTSVRYAHPWFGPMDAAGWHFMAGFHMGLHRKQIGLILAGLAR